MWSLQHPPIQNRVPVALVLATHFCLAQPATPAKGEPQLLLPTKSNILDLVNLDLQNHATKNIKFQRESARTLLTPTQQQINMESKKVFVEESPVASISVCSGARIKGHEDVTTKGFVVGVDFCDSNAGIRVPEQPS